MVGILVVVGLVEKVVVGVVVFVVVVMVVVAVVVPDVVQLRISCCACKIKKQFLSLPNLIKSLMYLKAHVYATII